MRVALIFIYFICCSYLASSQSTDIAVSNFYYYPHFAKGMVYFKTGQTTEAKLNYNLALEEMHFLNKNGDTLALANEETLKVIVVGKDSFYFDKGYLKIVATYDNFKLASKQKNAARALKQRGAYGEDISGTAAVKINNFLSADRASVKLNSTEGSYGNFEVDYFIMDANSTFIPVSKKNILKYFPNHKSEIETYITTNSLNLEQELDIKKLLLYASLLK
jgi:hypothetical protein